MPTPEPLPYATTTPGIGGQIKQSPEHFVVEELPLYVPSGSGVHVYLKIEREGFSTPEVVHALARAVGVHPSEVGYSGLKDKHARVIQWFSLPLASGEPGEVAERVEQATGLMVLDSSRHKNKLRRGHLLGNRFRVVISGVGADALELARATAAQLAEVGLPNFFGPQRFGRQGDNAERGKEVVQGRRVGSKWLRQLLVSAYQSLLFNRWLARRMNEGLFTRLIKGDIAKKLATGGLFTVTEPETEAMRMARWEITYTGPVFGHRMLPAQGLARQREVEILAEEGVTEAQLKAAKAMGSRRPARLPLPELEIRAHPQGIELGFALPKGSYATTLLREFIKP